MALYNHFNPLPMGAVKPMGWLAATLERQVKGLTGLLAEVPERKRFRINPVTERSVWLGGDTGTDFLVIRSERALYYVRGLVAAAAVSGDNRLMLKAEKWLDYWFDHQDIDGQLKVRGVSNFEWWPRMLMLDAIRFYYEAKRDERAIRFLERYFSFQRNHLDKHPLTKNIKYYPELLSWASLRGSDNIDSVAWLYNLTDDNKLISLTDTLEEQTFPWEETFVTDSFLATHAVNLAHGLRKPAIQHRIWPDDNHINSSEAGLNKALRLHGQVSGSISGDERTAGKSPLRGTELCTIVEMMRTFATALSVFGSPKHGDSLELIAFNALPAAIAPDFRSHQYFSQQNQLYCTLGKHGFDANKIDIPGAAGWYHDALTFGAPAGYQCCFYNLHLAWPLFISSMWMGYGHDGIAAVAYGPSRVENVIKGEKVVITEDTNYPFNENITFTVNVANPIDFAFLLRIPWWCKEATAKVGEDIYRGYSGTYVAMRRRWHDGDTVFLEMPVTPETFLYDKDTLAVRRGALIFALNPKESWVSTANSSSFPTFEVLPADEIERGETGSRIISKPPTWNRGIEKGVSLKVKNKFAKEESSSKIPSNEKPKNQVNQEKQLEDRIPETSEFFPWTPENAPLKIITEGIEVQEWSRRKTFFGSYNGAPIPKNISKNGRKKEEIALIPYGCARLRVSLFPKISDEKKG